MKTKKDIVENWLPRYTGIELEHFGQYILLTNYLYTVELFSKWHDVPVTGLDACAQCPWLKWTAEPRCGHPHKLDHGIDHTMEIPEWCPLEDLLSVGEDD